MTTPITQLTDIATETGNHIIERLGNQGWRLVKQYPPTMMDKGIDFDSYTLMRDAERIEFEWDNWCEWTITASPSIIATLIEEFHIS